VPWAETMGSAVAVPSRGVGPAVPSGEEGAPGSVGGVP